MFSRLSNQRPLPCEGSAIAFRRFLEVAKSLQTAEFIGVVLFLSFQVVCLDCCTVAAHEARSAGLEPATFSVRSHSPSQTGRDTGGQGETKQHFYQVLALLEGHRGTVRDTRLRSDCGKIWDSVGCLDHRTEA